jgi:hypothetical protein
MEDVSEAQGSNEPNHELGEAPAPAAAPETPPQASTMEAEASGGDDAPSGAEAS